MASKSLGYGFPTEAEYHGQQGSEPDSGLSPARATTVLAGGMDYVEPRDARLCAASRKDGSPCQAYAGTNGFCVGHIRQG